jgi:hypothetical protein
MVFLSLLFLFAYLSGSIPFGVILSKQKNISITEHGSGNIGATNVFRTVGKKAGLLTFAGDFFKGLIPVILALFLTQSEYAVGTVGFLAVIGHMYPVFLKFKGGKGVATSLSWNDAPYYIVGHPYMACHMHDNPICFTRLRHRFDFRTGHSRSFRYIEVLRCRFITPGHPDCLQTQE